MNYIAFATIALSLASTVPVPSRVEPVRIGIHGEPELDACLSIGQTTSAVGVRLAPTDTAAVSFSLKAGKDVYLCGSSSDGEWESVVIPKKAGQDCGVSSPIVAPIIYMGPCRSGWIPANRIRVVAG